MTETKTQLQNQSAYIRNLEVQVGQLANALSGRNHGVLPSQPEVNPKIQEHVKAITLQNGRPIKTAIDLDTETQQQHLKTKEKSSENCPPVAGPPQPSIVSSTENSAKPKQPPSKNLTPKSYVPPIPFPQRLKKNKKDAQFSKFLEIFRKLQITIPFGEAIEQMPNYGKFIKDILSKKRRLEDTEMVELTEE
ncbi:unnamed protein product [Prunus armeniaca]